MTIFLGARILEGLEDFRNILDGMGGNIIPGRNKYFFNCFGCISLVVSQILIEDPSEVAFCRAIVVTINWGNIKGQVLPVFDLTHIELYISLVVKFHSYEV